MHGGWSSWGTWGSCSKSCGTGYQDRHRSCASPVPAYGGSSCAGSSNQQTSCLIKHCPGKYGVRLRHTYTYFRSTNNDSFTLLWPSRALSILVHFIVHGGWSSWGAWGSCSRTIGTGTLNRQRRCAAPAPKYEGRSCTGQLTQGLMLYGYHQRENTGSRLFIEVKPRLDGVDIWMGDHLDKIPYAVLLGKSGCRSGHQ